MDLRDKKYIYIHTRNMDCRHIFFQILQSVATIAACFLFLRVKIGKVVLPQTFKTLLGISFSGIFIIYLLSGFNSTNHAEYFNILKNKTPFLFIPVSLN